MGNRILHVLLFVVLQAQKSVVPVILGCLNCYDGMGYTSVPNELFDSRATTMNLADNHETCRQLLIDNRQR